VIDKARVRSVNLHHFGVQGTGRMSRVRLRLLLLAALGLVGCSPQPRSDAVEDSLTSGRISIACPAEASRLIEREVSAFEALYPQSRIEIREGTSRAAIAGLFAAECDLAVITRELEPGERDAASRGGLELEGYRFARDAVVAIVHASNPVENITVQQLATLYSGAEKDWRSLSGRPGVVEPVAQPSTSDVTDFFIQEVMAGEPIRARVFPENSDSAVAARVGSHPNAVGYVTLAWADRSPRVLRIAPTVGLPYWRPDLEAVAKGDYPLTRFFNVYVRTSGKKLANGFITFITSRDGQKLVQESGLVPTSVPVRFVRRSPMLSTHRTGDSISTP
jgi:phosphate transport system substrate-binding protein